MFLLNLLLRKLGNLLKPIILEVVKNAIRRNINRTAMLILIRITRIPGSEQKLNKFGAPFVRAKKQSVVGFPYNSIRTSSVSEEGIYLGRYQYFDFESLSVGAFKKKCPTNTVAFVFLPRKSTKCSKCLGTKFSGYP